MTELGGAGTEFHEVSDPEFFHGLVKNAYDSHKFGKCVTVHEPQDYSGMRCFVAADHSAGFALRGDEIVSAFATGESRMNGHSILQLATDLGGRRLDCFDTVLPQLYGQMGFRAVSRIPFNEEYAPPGWNVKGEYDKYNDGKPDVVFMVYDPEAVEPYLPEHAKLLEDYDEAQAVQIKESEALKSKYHFERNIVNPVPLDASLQEKLKALKALTAENEAQIIQFTKEIDEATGAASKHSVKEDHKILAKSVRPSILNAKPWHGVEHIREVVTRTLRRFEEAGAVRLGRREVKVLNRSWLASVEDPFSGLL